MHNRENLTYRKNVSGFILDEQNNILLCKRVSRYLDWQLPQGGIDEGESAEEAIIRELKEEVNLVNPEIILKSAFSLNYEWPEELLDRGYRGQNQISFVLKSAKNWEPSFDTGPEIEFSASKWVGKDEFIELTKDTFRFETYFKFLHSFSTQIDFNK